jgi:RimJ/RimL family protein N-acetyltransferase
MCPACLGRPEELVRTAYAAVTLRPLEPGDDLSLREIFEGLGPRSRELRFLAPKPRLTSQDLRRLTAVDQHDHVALLAVEERHGRPIGVARFVREPSEPESADVAVAVVDAWQNRGVGTSLIAALVRRAREVGVRRFTLSMSRDNGAVAGLIRRMRVDVDCLELGRDVAEYAVTLPAAPWGARPRREDPA